MYTMILDGEYPNDIRVRKEAESLADSGIKIQVVTRWKKGQARKEMINGVQVIRLGTHYSFRKKGVNDIFTALFFFDFLFYWYLKSFFKKEVSSEIVHIHDLPLMRTIRILLPRKYIVLDMHENYPEMLLALKRTPKSLFKVIKDRLFFSTKRWKKYERKAIRFPNHIIAVVDEMKDKIIREYNIPSEKISVISNYEKFDFQTVKNEDDFLFKKDVFYIVYVGGINPVRGLEIGIHAVQSFQSSNTKVEFVILGAGNKSYLDSLETLAQNLGVSNQVHLLGQKPFNKIAYYIHNAGANVIPHIKNAHTDHTIPHKLFQIMVSKSPLLVSDCKPFKRIIGQHNAGFVFEAENIKSFKAQIELMMSNPSLVDERISNAFNLVKGDMNWESESQKLIKLIKKLKDDKAGINSKM